MRWRAIAAAGDESLASTLAPDFGGKTIPAIRSDVISSRKRRD